jgi:hypothetical protein
VPFGIARAQFWNTARAATKHVPNKNSLPK